MKPRSLFPLAGRILPLALALASSASVWATSFDLPTMEKVEKEIQAVAEKATPCTVALTHSMGGGMASGSAVIVGKNGLLLTAAHVVGDTQIIDVTFADGKRAHAKVLGADYDHDVAMAIITEPGDYPYMEMGDTTKMVPGDLLVALGHSGGFDLQRKPPVRFGRVFDINHERSIRSDCTLVGGDSGGPLFDLQGKVVGIHCSVGADMSINNDAPIEIVKRDWDRMVKGERWGTNPLTATHKFSKEELGGLDVHKFQERVLSEAGKNRGALAADPDALAGWLKDCGMKEEKVKAMDPAALSAFVEKLMGGVAQMEPRLSEDGAPSDLPAEELGGMDLKKFRQRLLEDALKKGGKLELVPATLREWLHDSGMSDERVQAMNDAQLVEFVQKALGKGAMVKAEGKLESNVEGGPSVAVDDKDLEGLDMEKFKKRIMEEALKSGGKLEVTPDKMNTLLAECGMKDEKIKTLSPEKFGGLVQKALGTDKKAASTPAKDLGEAFAGLDQEKLRKRVMAEAMKNQGRLQATPDIISGWLKDCGMAEEKVKALTPAQTAEVLKKVMNSGSTAGAMFTPVGGPSGEVIQKQDLEMYSTVKSGLDKVEPSMVSVRSGDKQLALGTVVKENGYILSKHSEVVKAKGALKVTFSDGRSFSATEVQTFPDHDLALLKIAAEKLQPITLAESQDGPRPGSFVFTPGAEAKQEMVAMGVASVPNRSLRESGGFMGIGLKPVEDGVEVGDVVSDGPAAKAGLKKGDLILSLNGKTFKEATDLSQFVRSLKAGDNVHVKYRRGQEEKSTELTLGDRAKLASAGGHTPEALKIGTEVSDVRTGYPVVFQHDQPLKPQDCGGAVLNLHGEVVGINIARVGRVDTYAIPAKTVTELLQSVDFAGLEIKAADRREDSDSI